jgi:hypothetical protein
MTRDPARTANRQERLVPVHRVCGCARGPVSLAHVRLTVFWERMQEQFGDVYAQSVAQDFVLADLGSRTVNQALADGEDVKVVWQAVCAAFRVPERLR